MLEITRELVEHYLRATGWTLHSSDAGACWRRNGNKYPFDAIPSYWIKDGALVMDVVARVTGHSDNLTSLAFRLGLCAAAEESEHFRLRWVDEKSLSEPVRYAVESSCRTMRDYYLECAGISADAWESARKR